MMLLIAGCSYPLAFVQGGAAGYRPSAPGCRAGQPVCKAPWRGFSLNMWYGDDIEVIPDDPWVSPWAAAHHKIRQQEIEIERCEFSLAQAVEAEAYDEAGGLSERVSRLRAQHPILPREERVETALADGDYALAAIFQKDLEAVKKNLGLPRFGVGQAVEHAHREPPLRGVVLDIDLSCTKPQEWWLAAGCAERPLELGYSADECDLDPERLAKWARQPFYVVLLDLDDAEAAPAGVDELLAAWFVDSRVAANQFPAPLYVAESSLRPNTADWSPRHPELGQLFDNDPAPAWLEHRGRVHRPAPALRLWQQRRAQQLQAAKREQRVGRIGRTLNDGTSWVF